MAGMAVLGLLTAVAAAVAMVLVFFRGEGDYGPVLVLFGFLTLGPAAALMWLGNST